MSVPVKTEPPPTYGLLTDVGKNIRRLVVENPSRFTYHGTGIYVVGKGNVAVIDPGPVNPSGVPALLTALQGESVSAILVTHTHLDHSPAAAELQAASGAKTYGFGPHGGGRNDTGGEEGADHNFDPDVRLDDGDTVRGSGWSLRAIHTPGHTSNHLCYELEGEKIVFTGDHIMGWSTTIVSPPDGSMVDYMTSLKKLITRNDRQYFPTHGASIDNPRDYVRSLLQHRLEREEQILPHLRASAKTVFELVAAIYVDVPTALHPAAARSVLSHLEKLLAESRVRELPDQDQGRYQIED